MIKTNSGIIAMAIMLFTCGCESMIDPFEVVSVTNVEAYDDVRWKDLSKLETQLDSPMIATLFFNEKTVWPDAFAPYAQGILEKCKNPGLGIRELHKRGINGKDIHVAIIDGYMCETVHPEYESKIVEYHEFRDHPREQPGMHQPGVVSLLAGNNIGVAPGVKIHYIATSSFQKDAKLFADALNWITDRNKTLPEESKIRVVSVSAAPSGERTFFTKNTALWDAAYLNATKSGILVLDCTLHHKIFRECFYNINHPDDLSQCTAGWINNTFSYSSYFDDYILVPASYRTQAEQYNENEFSYQYTGVGGSSWCVPYLTGVLAMGWQVNNTLSPTEIVDILFSTAYINNQNFKIINPAAFVSAIESRIKN